MYIPDTLFSLINHLQMPRRYLTDSSSSEDEESSKSTSPSSATASSIKEVIDQQGVGTPSEEEGAILEPSSEPEEEEEIVEEEEEEEEEEAADPEPVAKKVSEIFRPPAKSSVKRKSAEGKSIEPAAKTRKVNKIQPGSKKEQKKTSEEQEGRVQVQREKVPAQKGKVKRAKVKKAKVGAGSEESGEAVLHRKSAPDLTSKKRVKTIIGGLEKKLVPYYELIDKIEHLGNLIERK